MVALGGRLCHCRLERHRLRLRSAKASTNLGPLVVGRVRGEAGVTYRISGRGERARGGRVCPGVVTGRARQEVGARTAERLHWRVGG